MLRHCFDMVSPRRTRAASSERTFSVSQREFGGDQIPVMRDAAATDATFRHFNQVPVFLVTPMTMGLNEYRSTKLNEEIASLMRAVRVPGG